MSKQNIKGQWQHAEAFNKKSEISRKKVYIIKYLKYYKIWI